MPSETVKLLIDAGSTVVLSITLLIAVYLLTKGRGEDSAAIKHFGDAALEIAQANSRLAETLDRFSVAALDAAVSARTQAQNIAQVENSLEKHNIIQTRRDLATIERDRVTADAIEALVGRIQLVVQQDSNEVLLQIEMTLDDFMQRLTLQSMAKKAVESSDPPPEPVAGSKPISDDLTKHAAEVADKAEAAEPTGAASQPSSDPLPTNKEQ